MKKIIALLTITTILCGCTPRDRKDVYSESEVGKNSVVSFGKILTYRPVKIEATPSGAGMLAGGAAGGFAGSAVGSGSGNTAAILAGILVGAVAGSVAESALGEHNGIEYTIRFETLDLTKSIVQPIEEKEVPFAVGKCVMVQQNGEYQRVLPVADENLCAIADDSTTRRSKSVKRKKKAQDDE